MQIRIMQKQKRKRRKRNTNWLNTGKVKGKLELN